jgi:hypothetical protein
MDVLPITDGDSVESDEVGAVVGLELLKVENKGVQVLHRHLVVLNHHVRTVLN